MKKELIEVVKKIRAEQKIKEEWIDSLPPEISFAFFDNPAMNAESIKCDIAMEALFGEYWEDVSWFLFEFTPGNTDGPHVKYPDGREYTFHTDEDYYKYLEEI